MRQNTGSTIHVSDAKNLATTSGATNKDTTVQYLATSGNAKIDNKIVRGSGSKGLIIYVPGTLTINENICYGEGSCKDNMSSDLILKSRNNTSFDNIKQLPQIIIIANNIKIDNNVTQIDAWLIALSSDNNVNNNTRGGEIDTCVGYGDEFTSETCGKQLIINGPVIADYIALNRTAGAFTRWHDDQKDPNGSTKDAGSKNGD